MFGSTPVNSDLHAGRCMEVTWESHEGFCFIYERYLGKMSRIQAEQALSKMRDGVFLIRESDVRAGEYAIALK